MDEEITIDELEMRLKDLQKNFDILLEKFERYKEKKAADDLLK